MKGLLILLLSIIFILGGIKVVKDIKKTKVDTTIEPMYESVVQSDSATIDSIGEYILPHLTVECTDKRYYSFILNDVKRFEYARVILKIECKHNHIKNQDEFQNIQEVRDSPFFER